MVPAAVPKLLENIADRGPRLSHRTLPWCWAGVEQPGGRLCGKDLRGPLYSFRSMPPFPQRLHAQLGLLLPLCHNLGVGNREKVGVEAHGLPAVLIWAQFVPGA